VVGTAYKQESREKAIKLGLKFFGSKMVPLVEQVEAWLIQRQLPKKSPVVVHCWRGGMRSAGVAWLLDLFGFHVFTITGGYKAWRQWCLRQLDNPPPLLVLGGYTGCGKTDILQQLATMGEAVIDLEALASHKGSAFGNINMPPQPSQEMFENKLGLALFQKHGNTRVWMEDESQRIGDVNIPMPLFLHMRRSPWCMAEMDFENRLENIVKGYGGGQLEKLINAIARIERRLGGLEAKNATQYLLDGDFRSGFAILLRYYDKWYQKGIDRYRESTPDPAFSVKLTGTDACTNAAAVLQAEVEFAKNKTRLAAS
jgi:tRNA 2-selenouridine synthase